MFQLLLIIIYASFISLGLPDSLLGSAWPTIYPELGVPVSYAGFISMIIAVGTIFSSLKSDYLTQKLGAGKVTAISVAMTALALFGFSISPSFWFLCLWAIPYGLGAGSVDAALNNYVALHYTNRHMNWLHAMWGVGATLGPLVMGLALTNDLGWAMGYRYVSLLQIGLSVILIASLPLWQKNKTTSASDSEKIHVANRSLKEKLKISGAKEIMVTFFCYCALEQTAGLWSSSYLTLQNGLSSSEAAKYAGLFFLGITLGRVLSGFIAGYFDDKTLVRMGEGLILIGIFILFIPVLKNLTLMALLLIGLGCAPIYPSIIHATPKRFGAELSASIIGVQMASAYVGTLIMPPLFGILADYLGIHIFPIYLLLILIIMAIMHEKTIQATGH